ncbi:MAG: PAS domain S-box protein, partial [Bacteroidota bacterium]
MYLEKELYELIKTDESIFDFIQESSLDGLWYWDLENPENEWMNAKFWKVLGYNPDEMPHKSNTWQNIINQDDLKIAKDNLNKHCENPNHPYDQVVRYTHKNGSTVWIRCRGLAIRDKDGKPIRMLGAHQDISDIKKGEERFQRLFRDVESVAVQGYSLDGTVLYWNKASSRLYGYTEQEAVGRNLFELIIPSDVREAISNEIREMAKTRKPIPSSELTLMHKDGSPVTVFSSHSLIEVPNQEPEFFCIDIDLSARKHAEQQVIAAKEKAEVSEEKLKSIFRVAPTGIGIVTNRTLVEVNPKVCEMTGYRSEELLGQSARVLYPTQEEYDFVGREKYKQIAEHGTGTVETRWQRKDGQVIDVILSSTPVDSDDLSKGVTFTALDITKRKENEIQLQKAKNDLQTISDNMLDLVSVTDLQGNFKYVGSSHKILGYETDHLIGKNVMDFV